ncbi:hypothetical protein HGO34_23285 [Agrobacterium vitis]|uniref:Uncharacterized protein n=1 Tax=Agrobacterium vitis TaxID=373 RepID=A0AAE5AXF1_AGRVI|nr:hypothetical protein [Agrobacterium vitis]MCF1500334.1 hypothetical protein [Allorhizobium sp. Av2]MCM2442627.1 hypothetical protein [Agrobacterium vitis]MUZ60413.1 hypothetical protein [Agrobacterium vitis]MVA68350.1 hypothetical protein [Agrobacterium vitis]MVA88780.1 hypothetical protein [Agrobacterium vitis]
MSATISSTTTTSSSTVYQTKQTPKLPDDFYETEYTTLEDLPAEDTDSEPATVWGVLHLSTGTVTLYNEGGSRYNPYEQGTDFSEWGEGIDWENLDTPEERAAAIMEKHGGKLTASSVESGDKSLTSELMSTMFSSDALVDRMMMTSSGESLQEGLLSSDEEANGAQASGSAMSAASAVQPSQVQSTAA